MPDPLVSVVIPCLNAGAMLRPALESVVGQTHPAIEIVFADNGSTDGSVAVAEEVLGAHDRSFRIVACPERGVSNARNFGYPFATGAYIQWLDADDLLDADKIALQVAALEDATGYDIAYCDFTERFISNGAVKRERKRTLTQEKDQIFRALVGAWYPPHSLLVRRAAADRLQDRQAFNPTCRIVDDREYNCMAAMMGMRFLHVPGAHVVYHIWSVGQESQGASYIERARALEAVFARLKAFAQSLPRGALTDRHKTLLNQDWRVWTLPPGSLSVSRLDGRRARLQHAESGRTLDVRPREAAVAEALMTMGSALTTSHFALALMGGPKTADDPILVIETMQKLARADFLIEVTDSFA